MQKGRKNLIINEWQCWHQNNKSRTEWNGQFTISTGQLFNYANCRPINFSRMSKITVVASVFIPKQMPARVFIIKSVAWRSSHLRELLGNVLSSLVPHLVTLWIYISRCGLSKSTLCRSSSVGILAAGYFIVYSFFFFNFFTGISPFATIPVRVIDRIIFIIFLYIRFVFILFIN